MTSHSPAVIARADDGPPMPLVVGAIRSGTTLLRLMLDAHSQIAMAPETAFPESLFRTAIDLPGEEIAALVVAQAKWPDLGLDREAYLAACRARSGVEAMRLVWEHYRERHAKPIVGDKSPGYVRFLPTIERVLPGVRVIHLLRDGRDCFASQLHSRFSLYSNAIRPPAVQATEWCEAVCAGRRAGPSLAAYLEIRYEDLILDTARVLAEICQFLGVPYEPSMTAYHAHAEARLRELGDRVVEGGRRQTAGVRREAFALTRSAPDETRVGRWRETLLPDEVAAYETVAGPLLAACGYEPSSAILSRRDDAAAHDFAVASAAALARREYPEAKLYATLAFRADPQSVQRMRELQAVAEWGEDLAVHWRMEVACDESAEARFGGRLAAWGGEPIDADNRLFIWKSHRHLGAELRHVAALANLGDMVAHATVEVDPRLVPLVKRRFPSIDVVARGAGPADAVPPAASFHATWERLGHFLLPSAAAIPREPWLEAHPGRVRRFARRPFPRVIRPRVALVWHSINNDKSLPPLGAWRHLLSVPGVEFVSAQHGIEPRDLVEWQGMGGRVRVESVHLRDDLDGLAAVLRSCDLVVAISASQAHLAGALGVPTWLLLREAPILSWPLGRAATVWYPNTRCRWVRGGDDWEPAMRRVAKDLRSWRTAWRRRRLSQFFRRLAAP